MDTRHKRVWLHRVEPKNDLPEDVRKNAKRVLGSVFKNRKPLKGLSRDEEKEILPRIIDADPEDKTRFSEKASKYWKELSIDVPSGGKSLNISTDEDGDPVYPEEYVMYRFAQAHPQVAESHKVAQRNRNKLFWILDPEEEKKETRREVDKKMDAYREFIKVKDSEDKVDLMMRVFANERPEQIADFDEKINTLHNELEQRPEEFIELATDDDLEKQDFVLQCIEHGVLRKVGNQIMYMDEVIGEGIDEVVAYLKNKRNSSTLSSLKAELKEAK